MVLKLSNRINPPIREKIHNQSVQPTKKLAADFCVLPALRAWRTEYFTANIFGGPTDLTINLSPYSFLVYDNV